LQGLRLLRTFLVIFLFESGGERRRVIRELIITGTCVSLFVIYLIVERLKITRNANEIPLRICVTGTRGKSSVTRLTAGCLREAGMSVLAKTTGSRPCLIFPNGEEKDIERLGNPSILEGKKVLRLAARSKVHAVVMEMMSIRPESHYSEAVQMIKPHILVITNIREDHLAEMGPRKEDIARCFASALPRRCTAFIPAEEIYPVFEKKARDAQARIIPVPKDQPGMDVKWRARLPANEFGQNIGLAMAVAEFLEVDQGKAYLGLLKTQADFGSLKIWKIDSGPPSKTWFLVSAFAANDPESTKEVLNKLGDMGLFEKRKKIGLLNLRSDRGERTIQWLKALKNASAFPFDALVFIGEHARAMKARLEKHTQAEIHTFHTKKPEKLMTQIFLISGEEAVLIGMGNMGGMGQVLVDYWDQRGKPHDL
jgi:poly-gamma-glutamate synthase PgsB/CapB